MVEITGLPISATPYKRLTAWYKVLAKLMNTVLKADKEDPENPLLRKISWRNGVYMMIQFEPDSKKYGFITRFYDKEKEIILNNSHKTLKKLIMDSNLDINRSISLGDELTNLTIKIIATAIVFNQKGYTFKDIQDSISKVNAPIVIKRVIANTIDDDEDYYAILNSISELENSEVFKNKTLTEVKKYVNEHETNTSEYLTSTGLW